jgi:hypothetical protein
VAPAPIDFDMLVDRLAGLVAKHGALPAAELRKVRRHLPAMGSRLVALGLEVGSNVRRPLETQIRDLLRRGFVPAKGLERRLAGASGREVKEATARMVRRGEVVDVVRESGPGFALPSDDMLDPDDLAELVRSLTRLTKLVRRARPGRGGRPTLLRADVVGPLARWVATPTADAPGPPAADPAIVDALTREIQRRISKNPLPIHVPDLLRTTGTPVEGGKRALLEGAARGLFALEPESGMSRLSREDAELCPAGPMGTRLSWVTARQPRGAEP